MLDTEQQKEVEKLGIGSDITCAHCGEKIKDELFTPKCGFCGFHICSNCTESNCPKKP